jgi:putative hemolysin
MKVKLLLLLSFILLLAGCTQPTDAINPGTPNLPNPASVYCEQQGYLSEIRTASDGSQAGVCIFPDGSECDEWAYYRNECTPASIGGSLPNPASAFCEQQGYLSEIRTASDGSQAGVCIFPDGSECDEWAFFHGECQPGTPMTPTVSPEGNEQAWKTFTNDQLGYSFSYPSSAKVSLNDDPLQGLYISGEGMGAESWTVAHPSSLREYLPDIGTDLLQWLTDYNLLGEARQPDKLIAGTTAIHFRHAASPQSYAFDQYYFAHSGQLYQVTIGHSSEVEDWELNERFLESFQFTTPVADGALPLPTALPIDPAAYQGWVTYTHPAYGFTLRLPDGWAAEEADASDPLLVGHELNIYNVLAAQSNTIRLTFRRAGEDTLLWPTGVGEGEFVQQGTLEIAGQPANRMLLVCPSGKVTAIWYQQGKGQPNISLGSLEFGIIFSTVGHCEPASNLSGEAQLVGEMIIASINIP